MAAVAELLAVVGGLSEAEAAALDSVQLQVQLLAGQAQVQVRRLAELAQRQLVLVVLPRLQRPTAADPPLP